MSGRQLNFYLAPGDQAPFEDALRTAVDFVVLKSRSHSPLPEFLTTVVVTHFGSEPLRVLLAPPNEISAVSFQPIRGRTEFSCDPTLAPIIEFDRSYVGKDFIRLGRLYYVPRYLDAGRRPVSKSSGFLDWANRLMRAAKASLHEIERDTYAGSEAVALHRAGFHLRPL
jgi:hypothetical protein